MLQSCAYVPWGCGGKYEKLKGGQESKVRSKECGGTRLNESEVVKMNKRNLYLAASPIGFEYDIYRIKLGAVGAPLNIKSLKVIRWDFNIGLALIGIVYSRL